MDFDLGYEHYARSFRWAPDREPNPQYDGIPDEPFAGLIIDHPRHDNGEPCSGVVTFDTPVTARVFPNKPRWEIVNHDPLTLSPSIACSCGDHGFIQDGKWVNGN